MPNMSANINELAAALAKAQGALPTVPKTKTVRGKSYSYTYAPLDAVWDCCRKHLADNGLAVSQVMSESDGHPQIETILMHISGQWLASTLPLIATNDPQQLGSQITYMRRYALASLVGIATDEDDDGQASKPGAQQSQPRQPERQASTGTARPPVAGDMAEDVAAMFFALPEEVQAKLLKKYGSARDLEAVIPSLRDKIENEIAALYTDMHENGE